LKQKGIDAMDNVQNNTLDQTKQLQKNINGALNILVEEKKITKQESFNLKTSDPNPPSAWTAIKAHKPQKGYPARNIVSHIGCPQEPLAKELIRILRPLNANCPFNVKNSTEVTNHLKKLNLNTNDILVAFDATALYPSIPINECIELIAEKLRNDSTVPNSTVPNWYQETSRHSSISVWQHLNSFMMEPTIRLIIRAP
jgi:hypothetical protein